MILSPIEPERNSVCHPYDKQYIYKDQGEKQHRGLFRRAGWLVLLLNGKGFPGLEKTSIEIRP